MGFAVPPGGTKHILHKSAACSATSSSTLAGAMSVGRLNASGARQGTSEIGALCFLWLAHRGECLCSAHAPRIFVDVKNYRPDPRIDWRPQTTDPSCDETPLVALRSSKKVEVRPQAISLQAVYTADMDWATAWRHKVLEAVVVCSKNCSGKLAVSAFKHSVTARLLLLTGIGFSIADKPLWQLSTIVAQETAARTTEKWKDAIRDAVRAWWLERRPCGLWGVLSQLSPR